MEGTASLSFFFKMRVKKNGGLMRGYTEKGNDGRYLEDGPSSLARLKEGKQSTLGTPYLRG